MATVKPFRGMRYNVPDLSSVISQPYDRVRYGLQDRYYEQSPFNVVRIIRGKTLPADVPDRPGGPNVYTRAKAFYEAWRARDVLVQEAMPALYVYHQTFVVDGERRTRKGLICAFELSAFDEGVVLPHERTHAGPKVDRLRLLRSTQVNMGQIFMLYPDPQNKVTTILDAAISARQPDLDVVEMFEEDVVQRIWIVTDTATIQAVQDEMRPKRNLIIADGHHRYETALDYRDEMRLKHTGAPADAAFNSRMVTMVSMDDPGLVILPTHREVFDYPRAAAPDVLTRAASAFTIHPVADLSHCFSEMKASSSRHAFGYYAGGNYYVLVLKSADLVERRITGDRSLTWKSLDVSIVHRILLESVVGLSTEQIDSQANLRYHRDPSLAIENVDTGTGDCVFLLNPTQIAQVKACAEQGEKMPQKSTDFYPKMVTGLTMMPVGAGERI